VPIYETDDMVLIHLQMNKGDTSLFHKHSTPILYIAIQGAEMWLDIPNGKQRIVSLPDYWIGSDHYSEEEPFIHRIYVLNEGPLNLIAVLRKHSEQSARKFSTENFTYTDNGFGVKTDSITRLQNQTEKINIILSGQAELNNKNLGAGDYFLPGQMIHEPSKNFRYCAIYF